MPLRLTSREPKPRRSYSSLGTPPERGRAIASSSGSDRPRDLSRTPRWRLDTHRGTHRRYVAQFFAHMWPRRCSSATRRPTGNSPTTCWKVARARMPSACCSTPPPRSPMECATLVSRSSTRCAALSPVASADAPHSSADPRHPCADVDGIEIRGPLFGGALRHRGDGTSCQRCADARAGRAAAVSARMLGELAISGVVVIDGRHQA